MCNDNSNDKTTLNLFNNNSNNGETKIKLPNNNNKNKQYPMFFFI